MRRRRRTWRRTPRPSSSRPREASRIEPEAARSAFGAAHCPRSALGSVANGRRDARCHELALQWTHHISQAARDELTKKGVSLPLLPTRGEAEHLPALQAAGGATHDIVAKSVSSSVTCQVGHATQAVKRGK